MTIGFLADIIVVAHFVWILFMLSGFFITLAGFRYKKVLDWWLFRTSHLLGIIYVAVLSAMGRYCPLTVWEYSLRAGQGPQLSHEGSFIIRYIESLVYPDVSAIMIRLPTFFIAVFTFAVFAAKPPAKIKEKLTSVFGRKNSTGAPEKDES